MKNAVTFETATRLKVAGFPQPEPEAGQFWWGKKSAGDSEKGSICVLIGTDTGALNFMPVDGIENENNRYFVFAPTAADILLQMPQDTTLEWWEPAKEWVVDEYTTHQHVNPAEAAAIAWLSIHEKDLEV